MEQFQTRRLTWWPQLGIGWYPVECGIAPYDQDYFDRFKRDADTDLGRALMAARCDFVERHWQGLLIDVGIGSGAFIELRRSRLRDTYGYDVNPAGLRWLKQQRLLINPYLMPFEFAAVSLWDVLEHMPDFPMLLANVREWVFVSLPIFRDAEHALRSKHYRPEEHVWYFEEQGLIWIMEQLGFSCIEINDVETKIGREDIKSFAFRRRGVQNGNDLVSNLGL